MSTADLLPPFARWLKRQRQARDLSQEALAERVGCAPSTLQKLEQGARRPSRAMAERLADVLGVPAAERVALLRLARAPDEALAEAPAAAAHPAPEARGQRPPPLAVLPALVGREAERADLLRRLRDARQRLITLVGPGGIGKTTLALHVAATAAQDAALAPADGVAVVYLAALATARDVPLAIGEALGLSLQGTAPAEQQLVAALRGRGALLVLDNLEHLLGQPGGETLAALLGQLLAEAPGLRLLATSRERLAIPGEWVLELGGLALPPDAARASAGAEFGAVQLFLQRARQVAPTFGEGAATVRTVAAICRRLEGSPLAIELAASWARALSVDEIAAELDRALDFLAQAGRAANARHRSMRAALDHSWALLSPEEHAALARMSVFRGGCDRAAAAAVAGASLPLLTALLDKSLLRRGDARGGTRYLLHELVRQYAAERLDANPHERALAEAAHVAFYSVLLQQAIAPDTGASTLEARAALGREIDNLRAAWAGAASRGDTASVTAMLRGMVVLYEHNGWLQEGAQLFGAAADALGSAGSAANGLRGYLRIQQGSFLSRIGRAEQATVAMAEGEALVRASEALAGLGDITLQIAMVELRRARLPAAAALLERTVAAAQGAGDQFVRLWAELFLGWLARFRGDYAGAEAIITRCQALWREQGFARGDALALAHLGDLARIQGQHDLAAERLGAALQVASAAGDRWSLGIILCMLGAVAAERGDGEEALYLLTEGIAPLRELGEQWVLGSALCYLAHPAVARESGRAALRHLAEAVRIVAGGELIVLGELLYSLSRLCERRGEREAALALLLAIGGVAAEHWVARRAAERRAALESEMDAEQRARATALSRQPLLPWIEALTSRDL
jgi:predicted ATPase/DNA-binding XRE family transcriptional regulator